MIYNFTNFWQNFGTTPLVAKIDSYSEIETFWNRPKLEGEYEVLVSEKVVLNLYLFLQTDGNLKIKIHQEKQSSLKIVCCVESENKCNFILDWTLSGEKSIGELYLFSDLHKKAELNMDFNFLEKSPGGLLKIVQKNLLRDESKLSGNTNVSIHKKAIDSQSELKIRNLVLSSKSTAQVAPNLKIFCQDSLSKHSVATNSLDQNLIYYLKTRGLSSNDIQRIHLKAFKEEITSQLPLICLV